MIHIEIAISDINLTLFQVNKEALERARDVMISMKFSVRIFVIQMYGSDMRIILITALEEEMQEGMLGWREVHQTKQKY